MKKSIFTALLALFCFCGCQKPEKQFAETPPEISPVIPQETPAPDAISEEKQEVPTQTLQLHWPQFCNYTMDMSIEVPETWSMLSRASIWDEQERYTCGSNGVRTILEENQSLSTLHDLDPDSTLLSSEIVTINGKEYLLEINDVWSSEDISDPKTACGDHIYYNYYFLQDDHLVHFFFVHYENSAERLSLYEQILSSMQVEISNSYVKYAPLVRALDYSGMLDHEFTADNITDMTQWDWYYIFHALNDSRPITDEDGFRYWPAVEVESVLCTALSAEPSVIWNSTEFYDKERNIYMEPTGLGGAGPIGVITSAEENEALVALTIDLYSPDETESGPYQTSILTVEQTENGWKYLSNQIID